MREEDTKEYFDKGWLEYLRHLPEDIGHPLEVLVLRGHILIERQLINLIESEPRKPKVMNLERMGFASKVDLAEALYGDRIHEWVWKALRSVNKLRNSLAHKLEDADLPDHTQKFIEQIKFDDPWTFQLAGTELENLSWRTHWHGCTRGS